MGLEETATYGRASELCSIKRITTAGNIKDIAGKLYWLLITNSNTSKRTCILNNADNGTGGEIMKFFIPTETTLLFTFDPPIPFSTAICIGTIEHGEVIITAGYV